MSDFNAGILIFGALAVLAVVSALGVALSKSILYSGFSLLGTLVGVAGLYLFIGADFLGVVQLLIYVGGILVLILFAVLLTNRIGQIKVSNASMNFLAGVVGAVTIFVGLVYLALKTGWPRIETAAAPTTARLGDAFLREYLLPFELASLVLLMALVGAMVIARRAAKEPSLTPAEKPAVERLD
jgi:NAD(P)H-quinone oxidoreductase subunit 6